MIRRRPTFFFEGVMVPTYSRSRGQRPQQRVSVQIGRVVETIREQFPVEVAILERAGLSNQPIHGALASCVCFRERHVHYAHILEHCCAVGFAVQPVVARILRAGHWGAEAGRRSIRLAILHDCAKRIELVYYANSTYCPIHAPLNQKPDGVVVFIESVLHHLGFSPDERALILEARTCSALEHLSSYMSVDAQGQFHFDVSALSNLVVQVGDSITATNFNRESCQSDTTFLLPEERIVFTGLKQRFPNFPRLYGVSASGAIVPIKGEYDNSLISSNIVVFPAVPFLVELAHALAWATTYAAGKASVSAMSDLLSELRGSLAGSSPEGLYE